MPDYPTPDGDWASWIIGTLMAVLSAVVGTAVTLARMIENKYQKQVAGLEADIAALKIETKECQKDRLALSVRVASLEANTKALDQNTDAVNRNTHHADASHR
jgi:septal ring factor EnvC (AmiA/AmiB activator)